MSRLVAAAPGKLILVGEHAAVYGYPAVTTAIGLRARATFDRSAEGATELELELPDVGTAQRVGLDALRRLAADTRSAWLAWSAGGAEGPPPGGDGDPAFLVKIACGEALEALAQRGYELPTGRLLVRSEIPLGAGFGSSAAIASAVVGVLFAAAEASVSVDAVEPVVHEVERRQHGAPSGIDHGTVLSGGTLVARVEEGRGRRCTALDGAGRALARLRLFDTGTPAEPTGRVVAAVRDRCRIEPERLERAFAEMGRLVERSIDALARGGAELAPLFRAYERCLETLEVVPEVVQRAIRALETLGAGAKISGAGCHAGDAAGCLLVADLEELPEALAGYRELAVPLGVAGLRVEAAR